MCDSSNNIIGVTRRGTICCWLDSVGTTSLFKGGGSLLEVRAGVSKKDLILVGEVTGELYCWGEVKPSQNCRSLFITNANGVIGNELSCPSSHHILILMPWWLPVAISFRNVFELITC